jgi:hypothetical protein
MSECLFPTCKSHAQSNGYCIGHRIYASGVSVKVPKALNKISEKRKDINQALRTIYPSFLAKHSKCEIKSPECTKIATVIHHVEGRLPSKVLDQTTWMASCTRCNIYVEENDGWARDRGFKKSKF